MLLQSILSHYAKNNKSACLIFLDFEKAFDRISHTFMHMVLKEMNFGPKFRNCIKTLYAGASANVRLNNCDSANFGIKSGVRQGCPVSPLLFALCAETLANSIRSDKLINGLTTPAGRTIKISQYADDSTLLLKDHKSWERARYHITKFCKASCMSINEKKTEALWIGKQAGARSRFKFGHGQDMKWHNSTDIITALGCPVTRDNDLRKWWHEKLIKILYRLNTWSRLHPSFMEKIRISKLCMYSCIWFFNQCHVIPEDIRKSLSKMINSFLWSTKSAHQLISKSQPGLIKDECAQLYNKGGCKILHLDNEIAAFRAKWIVRLLDRKTKGKWKDYVIDEFEKAAISSTTPFSHWSQLFTRTLTKNQKNNLSNHLPEPWK